MNSTNGVGETHDNLAIRQTAVAAASGAAGVYTLDGWTPGSSLKSVIDLATGAEITDEFTEGSGGITRGAGNVAGAGNLLVLFIAAHPRGGSLRRR